MSCQDFETQIALAVEEELDTAAAADLARHLATCADCRELATALRASQQALKSHGALPLDPAALHAVRAGVRQSISTQRRARRMGILALAALLVLALGAAFLLRWSGGGGPAPHIAARLAPVVPVPLPPPAPELSSAPDSVPPPAPAPAPPPVIAAAVPAPVVPPVQDAVAAKSPMPSASLLPAPAPAASALPEPAAVVAETTPEIHDDEPSMVIKLVSDDPDVVIYWLVDETATGE